MNSRIKKLLIYLGIILILILSMAAVVTYFSEDKIRALAVEQLNKLLSTEVSVEKIEFSLFRRFPKASIQFKDIIIQESSNRKNKVNLLESKSLFLEFNPFDLLTGNYVIDEIYLSESKLNIEYFKDGSNNFQFLNSDETDASFQISLEKVVLNKSVISYHDPINKLVFKSGVKKLTLSGDFESKEFDLNFSTSGVMDRFDFKNISAKRSYLYTLDMVINIQRNTNLYTIKKAKSTLNNIPFTLTGKYQKFEEGSEMDLSFNSNKFTFKDAISFLPEEARKVLLGYHAKGTVNLSGTFKGKLDQRNNPSINIKYSLEKGELKHQKYNIQANDIVFIGSYTNGQSQNNSTSSFTIEKASFSGKYGESKGSMSIVNFNEPYLKFEVTSTLDLGNLRDILQNDSLEILEGKCHYYLKAETYLDSLNKIGVNDIKSAKASGNLSIMSGKIKWKGYKQAIENIEARTRFGDNLIYVDTLTYTLAGVYSEVNGKLHNFLPYLFFSGEKLTAQADLYYPNLDLNTILEVEGSKDEKAGFFLPVSDMIKLNVNLRADKFEIEKFKAENVTCEIISNYPYFITQNLSMDAMEGKFKGWMQFDLHNLNNISCTSKLTLEQVNINKLFYQFENFGQSSILSDNLYGYANAGIEFQGSFDRDLKIKEESIDAICHLEIKNGRLVNYRPIMALSKYVDVEELQDIKFSRLTNDIEIKNRLVFIPEMGIKSSALELTISGKHSFDNEIDYHFRLWLNDFLFKKAKRSKKNKEEFGDVEIDEEGRAKMYLRMVGTVDDYKIKYDRKALREKWKDDFKEERKELKELFHSEFGNKKKEDNEAPMNFDIEWEEFKQEPSVEDSISGSGKNDQQKSTKENKEKKKKSFLDKLGKDVEDEYEEYDPDKFD